MTDAVARATVERVGEFLVDIETGEIVGLAARDEAWQPSTRDDCDWVLSLILEARAQQVAIAHRREAILENLAAQDREQERRVEWLRRRFGAALEEAAREHTDDRRRSWRLDHGILKFRRKPGRWKVPDDATERVMDMIEDRTSGLSPDAVGYRRSLRVSYLSVQDWRVLAEAGHAVWVPEIDEFLIDVEGP